MKCNGGRFHPFVAAPGVTSTGGDEAKWRARLADNVSARFESRFSSVRVPADCRSPLLAGLRAARLGVWFAHGQGRFAFSGGAAHLQRLRSAGLVALEYVDDAGEATERYPHNPNGETTAEGGVGCVHWLLVCRPCVCDLVAMC